MSEWINAATFGWLCVETTLWLSSMNKSMAATFGWLCVETISAGELYQVGEAATFGWLCVETHQLLKVKG